MPLDGFDYVIVGAGSSGCVVARRLIENTNATVLVLEAGLSPEGVKSISEPGLWTENLGSQYDWDYAYAPNPFIDNRVIKQARGKGLGGSGSINATLWARGHRLDYDGWAAAGNEGWDYDSVLPLFKQSEDWEDGQSEFRGAGGPIHVERAKDVSLVSAALIDACTSLGMPYADDLNGPEPLGTGPVNVNVRDGVRCSAWTGYLQPVAGNGNLTVLTGAQAVKLRLTGTRCTGVDYIIDGALRSVQASRETIVAAGAIDSPRLLMLSGIGPNDDLKRLGIPTSVNLSGVGQNLQDHILLSGMFFEARSTQETLAGSRSGSTCFWKSRPELDVPDLMMMATRTPPTAQIKPEGVETFAIRPALMKFRSRGYLRMQTSAHDGPLEIQPNFLAEQADVDALARGVELGLEIASQPAFRDLIKTWIHPVMPMSRAETEAFLRQSCWTYHHPVGTCAMGSGSAAVVDNALRVHGVDGLRVVDASVMPTIPSANTNAACVMIGEFAARSIMAA
jgi:choline dehydrogenase